MKRTTMKTKCMRWNRFLRLWFRAVVLAVWALCVSVALAGTSAHHYRVAILTLGGLHNVALEGFREELARRGYHEGKTFPSWSKTCKGRSAPLPTGLQELWRPNLISFSP